MPPSNGASASLHSSSNRRTTAWPDRRARGFAREPGLEPLTTPVRPLRGNGRAESFVNTMKHDHVAHMGKPDAPTARSRPARLRRSVKNPRFAPVNACSRRRHPSMVRAA
jgi:hypothetical protein